MDSRSIVTEYIVAGCCDVPPISRIFSYKKSFGPKDSFVFPSRIQTHFSQALRVSVLTLGGISLIFPFPVSAGMLSSFTRTVQADSVGSYSASNSQKMVLPQALIGPSVVLTGGVTVDAPVIKEAALAPLVGPRGSALDVATLSQNGGQLSVYTVHAGDTLAEVAEMFGVTKTTITSVNDLSMNAPLVAGQVLVILPLSGYQHTVLRGETLSSISKKTKVPAVDIAYANDIAINTVLSEGSILIIPAVDLHTPPAPLSVEAPTSVGEIVHPLKDTSKYNLGGALLRPVALAASIQSQGAHGWDGSAVDLAAPIGTPVVSAASGVVLLARTGGYNGGYGNYIIVMSEIAGHKVETLYAHLSKVTTVTGAAVVRGEQIGLVGRSGDATGSHLHFEVRGAQNPLVGNPKYTGE